MMVLVILRDDGQADNWAAFEREAAGILREHAAHVHGIWPAVEGWAPRIRTAVMSVELPDDPSRPSEALDPQIASKVREQLAECRQRHGAEQVAWFVPDQIDTL